MMYPLVRDLAADGIPVAVTCRVLGFSKQAFYKWRANPVTAAGLGRRAPDQRRDRHPRTTTRRSATGSSPTNCAAHGITAGANRVARLCSQQRIWSVFAKKRGPDRKAGPPVHDDLVERGFTADGPEPAVADRHHRAPHRARASSTCARSRTCAPTRIVGYSIDSRMKASLAVAALSQRDRAARSGRHDGALRPRQPGRIQPVVATPCCGLERSWSASTSVGVFQPSVFRGRLLSASATA